jgi:hypothetical protein
LIQGRTLLKVFAILFALLAVSNLSKPLELSGTAGFVLFGKRLSGTANLLAGPLFGAFLAVYAYGVWMLRRFALPMGLVYAAYVIVNLALWNLRMPAERTSFAFGLAYATVALGVSWGSAYLLYKNRAHLS